LLRVGHEVIDPPIRGHMTTEIDLDLGQVAGIFQKDGIGDTAREHQAELEPAGVGFGPRPTATSKIWPKAVSLHIPSWG